MGPDHYAKEADRLLRDDTLNHALDAVRREALEDLSRADAGNTVSILRLQQKVAAIDEIRSELKAAILRRSNAASPVGTVA